MGLQTQIKSSWKTLASARQLGVAEWIRSSLEVTQINSTLSRVALKVKS